MIERKIGLPFGVSIDLFAARLVGREAWVTAHHGALLALDLRAAIHVGPRVLKASVVAADTRRRAL